MNAQYTLANGTTHTITAASEANFLLQVNQLSLTGVLIVPIYTDAVTGKRTWASFNTLQIVGLLTEL
jgi:hypothetical protein